MYKHTFLSYHKWTQTLLFLLLFIFSHFPVHSRFTVLYISLNLLLSWGDHTVLPMVHMELSGSSFYLSVRIFTGKACVVSTCFTTKTGVSTWGSKTSKQVKQVSICWDNQCTNEMYTDGEPVVYRGGFRSGQLYPCLPCLHHLVLSFGTTVQYRMSQC